MRLPEDTRTRLLGLLDQRLGTRASVLLMGRLRAVVEGLRDDPGSLDEGLKKIRVAVKLFVDEGLAASLHDELLALCRRG